MLASLYPSLYQINTRAWLRDLSAAFGRPITLQDVPDAALDELAGHGFEWVWLLGVWQTGPAGRATALGRADRRQEFQATLPDLPAHDITGSPFAVQGYTVHADFGGDFALAPLRQRLLERGLRLV